MSVTESTVTRLELRESNPDGTEGAGLSHSSEGLVLLHVLELASMGEPRGGVTVLHDVGDHGGRYQRLAQILSQDGWAIALPDLRGHGQSEGVRGHSWGLPEVVRDVDSVQDHLAYRLPDSPKILIGIGVGGVYALAYALQKPDQVAAVVAVGPVLDPSFDVPRKKSGIAGLFKKVGPTTPGVAGHPAEKMTTDPEEQRRYAGDEHVHDVVTVRAAEVIAEAARGVREGIGGIGVPVLVLHGADDELAAVGDSEGLGAGSVEVRVLGGMRHDVFHERNSEEVMEEVRDWINENVEGV